MKTDQWFFHRRAQDCIAQSYLTDEKRPEHLVTGIYPTHVARGQGCFLWDHNGKKYLDLISGLGMNLVGYANPKVNAAMIAQIGKGACHSLPTHLELEAAEKLKELFTFVDAVKWVKTSRDAISLAFDIAREKTGRRGVYHENIDSGSLESIPSDAAAVIVRPFDEDGSFDRIEWLKRLRDRCTEQGALLIFDEVDSGLRIPKYSVAGITGVEPDLICLGRAIAGGMPLAAVAGKYAVMNSGYQWSSTSAGEAVSLAAAVATMKLVQTELSVAWLWSNGEKFLEDFNAIYPEKIRLVGYPTRAVFKGDERTKALFFQECCRAGILVGPVFWLSFPAIEEVQNALIAMTAILGRISRGEVEMHHEGDNG